MTFELRQLTKNLLKRVTAVFFKSLYASQKDVVDAAHEGLKIILGDQSRFPKDILQTGLRTIL